MSRTQEEILARIAGCVQDDLMGWRREVLIDALEFQLAKPFLADHVTPHMWHPTLGDEATLAAADRYFAFAIGKMSTHRGLSASRSVHKLREFAWLLGRDNVVGAMDAVPYPQYGVPKARAFGQAFGWWAGHVNAELANMASGEPCTPNCPNGCGT